MASRTMKAANYIGPYKVQVQEVEMPKLEHPDDIIVKAAICSSGLQGILQELGEGVTLLKKGDRVVMPFNVAHGRCRNCDEGKTASCTGVSPGFAGGAYAM
ncbi:hypothetical protein BBP40_002024 [Aspergillus hancockii]|nr:hypothetical protein BBP40_002024 [Aspergillus hancockii]